MGWVCARGKTLLVLCPFKMDGPAYVQMLHEALMPLLEREYIEKDDFELFQQNHAACNTAKITQKFSVSTSIDVLPWASTSPVINMIESLWGLLVRRVHVGYRQFESIDDLKEALTYEW